VLELHELQVFLVAAETENFSETGRLMQISQPAVSGHIQSLEQRLNTRLFERSGRNIKLNETGEAFVPIVRNLLKEAREAEEFIASQQGRVIGQITLGCSTAVGKYTLPQIMSRFLGSHPNVRMQCRVGPRGQALDQLFSGEIDLAVSSLRVPRRAFEYRHFADDLLVLIVPPQHPWASAGTIQPDDLVDHELIFREPSSGAMTTLNRELMKFDMSCDVLQSRLMLWSSEAIVQAVANGLAPAFTSRQIAASALQHESVVEVKVSGLNLVQPLWMVRNADFRVTDAQRAFWDFVFAPENEDSRQFHS
jgi:DNA-binding transcriptional LysR family regulator